MIYLVISSSGSYQLNSFNPHMVVGFTNNISKLLTEDWKRIYNRLTITSIEDHIDQLNNIRPGLVTYTYLPPVATQADLLTTYPELFI